MAAECHIEADRAERLAREHCEGAGHHSKFPRAVESFLHMPLSEDSKRKILWDNCAAYYGLTA